MTKRIITISREFGSGGRFIGEEVAKSQDWHRSILRKMLSCHQRKGFLHMHLPVVILQENQ